MRLFVAFLMSALCSATNGSSQDAPPTLPSRTFNLSTTQAAHVLERSVAADFLGQQGELWSFLLGHGASLSQERGDNLFFNDRTRALTIRAPREQLNRIESIFAAIDQTPVVKFEVKLLEAAADSLPGELQDCAMITFRRETAPRLNSARSRIQPIDPDQLRELGVDLGFMPLHLFEQQRIFWRVLTNPELRKVLKQLEAEPGSDLVKLPEIRAAHGKEIRLLSPAE